MRCFRYSTAGPLPVPSLHYSFAPVARNVHSLVARAPCGDARRARADVVPGLFVPSWLARPRRHPHTGGTQVSKRMASIDIIADEYVDRAAALDPLLATSAGIADTMVRCRTSARTALPRGPSWTA